MRHNEIHGEGTSVWALEANTSAQAATRAGVMTVGTEGEGSRVGATVGWVMSVVSFVE
jgi:flavin reductase (DIM6/NTAB) family NADH-FMN oxidoreductase RutF